MILICTLKDKMVEQIKIEISTMKLVKHPNIVQLFEVMASKTKIYFVLEYVTGGELFNQIAQHGKLKEDDARKYFQQLINAVDYCHSRGVYHRDLKPENLLLDSKGNLKISDFGLSLVLTILECKGLEFQDVLLYNFFTSSPLATKWRVIYHLMDQKASNSFDKKAYPKFLKFDNGKHNLLCSELKHLYVAITRAKQRLWIYEENRDLAKPILDYWKEMGLIQLRCLDSSLVESMYVASSFEDWKKRGIQMFNEQNYDMAIVCFERARDSNMAKWAKAASLRQSGQRLLEFNPESAKNLLKEAAMPIYQYGESKATTQKDQNQKR